MDQPFSPSTNAPFKVQNYHFQAIVNKLTYTSQDPLELPLTYAFFVCDTLKKHQVSAPIVISEQKKEYDVDNVKVNFVAISYNPGKQLDYFLRLLQKRKVGNDREIGEFVIDGNDLIDQYLRNDNGAFTMHAKINAEWEADIEIYLGNNRYGMEQTKRAIKNPKPKNENDPPPKTQQAVKAPFKRRTDEAEEEDIKDSRRPNRKFQKFSPRRTSPSPKPAEPVRKDSDEVLAPHKFERSVQQAPKQRKPKDEWLIPQAEQFMSKPKKVSKSREVTRQDSRLSEPKSEKKASGSELKLTVETVQPAAFNPLSPKVLIPAIVAILILGYFLLFTGGKQTKPTMKPPQPQEATERVSKRRPKTKKRK